MSWLNKYTPSWRVGVFYLLLILFLAPWGYDRLHVPAQYDCSGFNFRLEEDFCGAPVSGLRAVAVGVGIVISAVANPVTGASPDPLFARNL